MRTRRIAYAAAGTVFAFAGLAASVVPTPIEAKPLTVRRGVSISGAEFGVEKAGFSNATPGQFGRDYTFNTERTTRHLCENGLSLIRIPVRWERLQPRLGGDLDGLELSRLKVAVGWARKHGGSAIIDLHNYGRYTLATDGRRRECVIDEEVGGTRPVTREHFADFWRRLAEAFRGESAVQAFGLMNEPHDMGRSDWKGISQLAVEAIRSTGDTRTILVAGNDWSKSQTFATANGSAWIRDPANNIAYEAHCYFDRDGSGRYLRSFAAELADDPTLIERGATRLKAFVEWCRTNGVKGFIGEYGVPRDTAWQPVLAKFVAVLDEAGLDACAWGGGEWWGSDPLSIQPSGDFQANAPQMSHLAKSR